MQAVHQVRRNRNLRMKHDRKIILRRIIATLILLGIILAIIGYALSIYIRDEIRKERYRDVTAIANLKVRKITRWISERKSEGLFLQENPDFRVMIDDLIKSPSDQELIDQIDAWLHPILNNHDYWSIHVLNSDLNLAGSFFSKHSENKIKYNVANFDTALSQAVEISTGNMYVDANTGNYCLDLIVPLSKGDQITGRIVMVINPEIVLFPSVVEWPVTSATSEAMLVKQEGDSIVFLNTLRFLENKPLMFRMKYNLSTEVLEDDDIEGFEGFYIVTDYRGERTLSRKVPVPGTDWILIAKVDQKEVYGALRNRSVFIALVAIALLGLTASSLVSVWRRNEAILLRRQLELEKETKALEQHYASLTRYANDIIILLNNKAEILQINERGLERYGYTLDEIKGQHIGKIRAKSTISALNQQLSQVLEKGEIRFESWHVTKSGEEFPVETSARSIKIDDSVFIQSIVRDITSRKRYEQAIIERENNLNITLESIGDAVIVTDKQGHITRINRIAEELTGWSAAQAVTKPLETVFRIRNADDGAFYENFTGNVIEDGGIVKLSANTELVTTDGRMIRIADSAAPIRDHDNHVVGVVIVFRDVTEKYEQERVLRESEEKFRLLAESSPVAIMIYQRHRWVYTNPGATRITGYSSEEILGMNFWEIVHPGDQSMVKERGFARQAGENVPSRYQFRIITKGGGVRWVDLTGTLISYKGEPAGMISVMDVTEQNESLLKIAESESRLSSIFKAAPIGIGVSVERRLNEVNDRISFLTGYHREELIGQNARLLYCTDEEYERVAETNYKQIQIKGVGEIETRWKKKSGEIIDVLIRTVPLDLRDSIKGFMFTVLDITERKHAEESIRESQRMLYTLISNLQGIVYRCKNEPVWPMLFLSEGFQHILGHDISQYVGESSLSYADLIHPEDREIVWEKVQKAVREFDSYEFEFRLLTSKGDYRWMWEKGRGVYNTDGKLICLEGFISDYAWRKRNEEIQRVVFNIANAVNFTSNIIELSSYIREELSSVVDTENFFIALYNEQAGTISLPFIADQKDKFKTYPAGKTLSGYVITNDTPLLIKHEEIMRMRDEGLVEFYGTVSKVWLGVPLRYRDKIIGAVVIQNYENENTYNENDLEIMKFVSNQIALSIARKQTEDELRLAKEKAVEADKLKTAFLSNMSHEIRTPMNAIIGFSDLLAEPGLDDDERKNFSHIIQNNGGVLLNLIDDIIDMAKLEAGQLRIDIQPVNVNEVLNELFDYFNELRYKMNKGHIELRFPQYRSGRLELMTDALRFRQIISNLLNNALKFTEKGYIEMGYMKGAPENSQRNLPAQSLTFYVKDTGVGIPEEKINLVFDRFRQAYESHSRLFGGTGLGLTISKNLSELLGGRIWAESVVGIGTTFYVALPANTVDVADKTDEPQATDEPKEFNGIGMHVLIVEDEPSSALFLKAIIEKSGAKVSIAENGQTAVELCTDESGIDLVFMDLRMPVMDGYEATRVIKAKYPGMPVIAQTAFAMPEEIERSFRIGCNDHITKPLRPSEVITTLKKYSRKRQLN